MNPLIQATQVSYEDKLKRYDGRVIAEIHKFAGTREQGIISVDSHPESFRCIAELADYSSIGKSIGETLAATRWHQQLFALGFQTEFEPNLSLVNVECSRVTEFGGFSLEELGENNDGSLESAITLISLQNQRTKYEPDGYVFAVPVAVYANGLIHAAIIDTFSGTYPRMMQRRDIFDQHEVNPYEIYPQITLPSGYTLEEFTVDPAIKTQWTKIIREPIWKQQSDQSEQGRSSVRQELFVRMEGQIPFNNPAENSLHSFNTPQMDCSGLVMLIPDFTPKLDVKVVSPLFDDGVMGNITIQKQILGVSSEDDKTLVWEQDQEATITLYNQVSSLKRFSDLPKVRFNAQGVVCGGDIGRTNIRLKRRIEANIDYTTIIRHILNPNNNDIQVRLFKFSVFSNSPGAGDLSSGRR